MPQKIDKKYNVVFYIIILFIVSSINNNYLIENQNSYFKIKNIQVEGLEVSQNLKIKKKLNFLVGKNIFNLDVEKLETKLNSFKYIENYKVSKLFPSIATNKSSDNEVPLKSPVPHVIKDANGVMYPLFAPLISEEPKPLAP